MKAKDENISDQSADLGGEKKRQVYAYREENDGENKTIYFTHVILTRT